jgi:hypothetical protein
VPASTAPNVNTGGNDTRASLSFDGERGNAADGLAERRAHRHRR